MTPMPALSEDPVALPLAASTAAMPLLPYGPVYLGLGRGPWVAVGLLLLLLLWVADRLRRPAVGGDRPAAGRRSRVDLALAVWVACVLGGGLLGVLMENRVGSPVFAAHLRELPARLAGPLDQEFDVLYPARMTIVTLLGPVALLLMRDLCRRDASRRRARLAIGGWLVGFGAVSAIAVLQYATGAGLHPDWVRMEPGVTRAHATLDDPNALGAYLAIGVAAMVTMGIAGLRVGRRTGWSLSAAALGALALLTSLSRSGWIAVAMVCLAVVLAPGLLRRRPAWIRAAIAVVLALAGLAVVLWARIPAATEGGDPGTGEPTAVTAELGDRGALWGAALEMAARHPLTGVGLGRYRPVLREIEPQLGYTENAHSYPLQVLAETGGVGLLALLGLSGALAIRLGRSARGRSSEAGLVLGGGAGLAAFAVTQLSGNALLLPSGQVLPGLLAGALLATGRDDPGSDLRDGSHRAVGALIALAALLCYVVAGALRPWPPRPADPWGYAWGLHAPERPSRPWPEGRVSAAWEGMGIPARDADLRRWAFRWTRDRAILEARAPLGTRTVLLPIQVPAPATGAPVTVWVFAEGGEPRTLQGSGRRLLEIPIRPVDAADGRRVRIRIEVDGAFRPSTVTGSEDDRLLGISLWPLAYEDSR